MSSITRALRLLAAIPEAPDWTTSARLARHIDVTQRTAQRHLAELRRLGMVACSRAHGGDDPARWWRVPDVGRK
jgi:DNA-binding IclR family transcriptional regulator